MTKGERARPSNTEAEEIVGLLAAKHHGDVFVAGCKMGPTQPGLLALDAWALKRSWTNPDAHGYEVKVSRADFLRDEKWRGYLPACNYFSFVAPRGLIDRAELPEEVGLLEVVGSRLVTRRKAVYRPVDLHEGVARYVLMWRARIGADHADPAGRWRAWLETKAVNRSLGQEVSAGVRDVVRAVRDECDGLRAENARLGRVRAMLEELGLSADAKGVRALVSLLDAGHGALLWRAEQLARDAEALRKIVAERGAEIAARKAGARP